MILYHGFFLFREYQYKKIKIKYEVENFFTDLIIEHISQSTNEHETVKSIRFRRNKLRMRRF